MLIIMFYSLFCCHWSVQEKSGLDKLLSKKAHEAQSAPTPEEKAGLAADSASLPLLFP